MIESDRFYQMLGLCMRAGQLTLGEDGVRKAIATGKAALILVDAEASANTKKRFSDACAFYGASCLETAPGRLGEAVGKPGRMSAAVQAGSMAERLVELAQKAP